MCLLLLITKLRKIPKKFHQSSINTPKNKNVSFPLDFTCKEDMAEHRGISLTTQLVRDFLSLPPADQKQITDLLSPGFPLEKFKLKHLAMFHVCLDKLYTLNSFNHSINKEFKGN